jgi:uncharacterized protein YcbX
MAAVRVTALHLYPVKSAAGVAVQEATVRPHGLEHDRRWMVIGEDGGKLSPPRHKAMMTVTAGPRDDGGIVLAAPGREPLQVDPPVGGAQVPTVLSRLDTARAAGPAADRWLSEVLGVPARLVWMDDPSRRPIGEKHGGRDGDVMSLADAGPVLLTSMASLRRLEEWVGMPLAMGRFRPNVVIDGDLEPFAEDDWPEVTIGGVRYRHGEVCDRCVVTTLDPATGAGGPEPIRTLARHRKWDGEVYFGVRLIPVGSGVIRVGDAVSPD